MPEAIGKGSYGVVKKSGNLAQKKFHKLSHLIQEYLAIRYLNNVEYVVKCKGVKFENLELYMELHQMNMRDWLSNKDIKDERCKPNFKNKMKVLNDILKGLYYIHGLDLVHGDLKPSNILVDCQRGSVKAKIADLGFVSIDRFAKVERTAELYRDLKIQHSNTHDIYSLAIIMLEMFGNIKLKEQPRSYKYLHDVIRKRITNETMADLLVSMTHEDPDQRPDVSYILKEMYQGNLEKIDIPTIEPLLEDAEIDEDWDNQLYNWFGYYAKKHRLDVGRTRRGYFALVRYLTDNKSISQEDYKLYMCTMLLIISSAFRRASVYKIQYALDACRNYGKYTRQDVLDCLESLLSDDRVVTILMAPSRKK